VKADRKHRLHDRREHVVCEVTTQPPRVGRGWTAGVTSCRCPTRPRGGHSGHEVGISACSSGRRGGEGQVRGRPTDLVDHNGPCNEGTGRGDFERRVSVGGENVHRTAFIIPVIFSVPQGVATFGHLSLNKSGDLQPESRRYFIID